MNGFVIGVMIIIYIGLFVLTAIMVAFYIKEPYTGPTGEKGPTGSGVTGGTGATMQVSLMHWSPHWQCTTKPCCADVASNYINTTIVNRQVDFAHIIELENTSYRPPPNYTLIKANCGDQSTLIYNIKWKPIGSYHIFCINDAGTIGSSGRPTIVQQFQYNGFTTFVIASHFTHFRNNYISGLNKALTSLGITSKDTIVFMGDTNQEGSSETLITDILQGRPSNIKASTVAGTCCYNGPNSKFPLKYDRIIATFGSYISTDLPTFHEVIPNPITGCSYAEMHLPVLSNIIVQL
jgi:hypothetical protein